MTDDTIRQKIYKFLYDQNFIWKLEQVMSDYIFWLNIKRYYFNDTKLKRSMLMLKGLIYYIAFFSFLYQRERKGYWLFLFPTLNLSEYMIDCTSLESQLQCLIIDQDVRLLANDYASIVCHMKSLSALWCLK